MEKVLHPAKRRGTADFGWLKANYSFSFANYFNPDKLQFGLLRVLNDDRVKGGMGFGTHPHKNMEIISIPLSGQIKHKDSMDHTATIKTGEVQVMSAGTGVTHSEFNPSNEELNLLQIWIFPERNGLEPRYAQKDFSKHLKENRLINIVSPGTDQNKEALWINQQAYLHLGSFEADHEITYQLRQEGHGVYLFIIEGELNFDDSVLHERDAAGIWNTSNITLKTNKKSKILLIEVPMN